jgi:hypothetical protein
MEAVRHPLRSSVSPSVLGLRHLAGPARGASQPAVLNLQRARPRAMTAWVPKPVEFEWFVSELTVGRGFWVEAYIDTQIRGLELDGWRVESWLHPTQTHHRRLVVHACRRIAERGS